MRATAMLIATLAAGLAACAPAPNPYPDAVRSRFAATCPLGDPRCACTWDQITRTLTAEEYQAALVRFRHDGLMDPRITHARTYCVEHRQ